jgi:hypothetical protein
MVVGQSKPFAQHHLPCNFHWGLLFLLPKQFHVKSLYVRRHFLVINPMSGE